MTYNPFNTSNLRIIIIFLLGIFAFIYFTGGTILSPIYTDWILLKGDPSTHYLGWEFYRQTPIVQWPIGANPNYGIVNSIVYTDSIPLLALAFKPFQSLLPTPFQYLGIWVLLCFVLQAFFSWKLLSLFTNDKILPIIASVFFIFSPIFLHRLGGHYALAGHWVILTSLYLYFSKRFSNKYWIAIITITSLIHAYLLLMVLSIWSADLLQRWLNKQIRLTKIIKHFLSTLSILLLVMWAIGYFIMESSGGITGFGYYRMNLLSLFDTNNIWSKIMPDLKNTKGDGEGFNYLGIGILLLMIPTIISIFFTKLTFSKTVILPLLIISIILFLYALSNKIALGSEEIFSYPVPHIFEYITRAFRVSGRLFWPVYYLIYVLIFFFLFKIKNKQLVIFIISAIVIIQLYDTSKLINNYKNNFVEPKVFKTIVKSPLWDEIAKKYSTITYVYPKNAPKNWKSLSIYANQNSMSINIGYFARINKLEQSKAKVKIKTDISNKTLNKNSIYIFEDKQLWSKIIRSSKQDDIVGEIDGLKIFLPNGKHHDFNNAKDINNKTQRDIEQLLSYSLGKKLTFTFKSLDTNYLLEGWSNPSKNGVWSVGKISELKFIIPNNNKKLKIFIDAYAYLKNEHTSQSILVLVNNIVIGKLYYQIFKNNSVQSLSIPINSLTNNRLVLKFIHENPKSPAELSHSKDERKLSLKLRSLIIQEN